MPTRFTYALLLCSVGIGCHRVQPTTSSTPEPVLYLDYEGAAEAEAHYRVPGERRPFELALRYVRDGRVERVELTMGGSTEISWVSGDVVVSEVEGKATRHSGQEAGRKRHLVRALAGALGPGDATRRHYAHPTFGDVVDEVAYGPESEMAGTAAAEAIEITQHETDLVWFASLRRVSATAGTARSMPTAPVEAPAEVVVPHVEAVAEGVWSVASHASDTTSLVVEFEDFLVVAETSLTVASGEAIVDALHDSFPDKPIRYVLFSHYHPHYTGGLRAFLAAGATVLAPPGNARFAQGIAERPFTMEPDRWSRMPGPAKVEIFEERIVIEDANNRLDAIDIGADSDHTDEYVVFHLPKSGVLFQGDLGWYALGDGGIRASGRAPALLRAIEERALSVDTLLQGWPIQSAVSVDELSAAVVP